MFSNRLKTKLGPRLFNTCQSFNAVFSRYDQLSLSHTHYLSLLHTRTLSLAVLHAYTYTHSLSLSYRHTLYLSLTHTYTHATFSQVKLICCRQFQILDNASNKQSELSNDRKYRLLDCNSFHRQRTTSGLDIWALKASYLINQKRMMDNHVCHIFAISFTHTLENTHSDYLSIRLSCYFFMYLYFFDSSF